MGEATDQIMNQIEVERGRLGADLNELEGKVKRGISIDWRRQFDEKPLLMLGLAVGGGILLASLINKGSRDDDYDDDDYVTSSAAGGSALVSSNATSYQKRKAAETFDNIKGALIGVAVSSVRKFLDDAVPGFTDQFRQTEEKASSLRGSLPDSGLSSGSSSYSGAETGYTGAGAGTGYAGSGIGSTGLDQTAGSTGSSSYGSGTGSGAGSYGSTGSGSSGSSYGSSGSSYDPSTTSSRSYSSSDPNVPSSS